MFFIRNAPESLAAKAHHSHNITADPLGILTEKTQLNLFGFGYVTVFTRILKEGRAQVLTPARKITTRRKANPSSAKMLLLLLLLSGNVHLNPGPLCHSEVNPTVQNIIPLQTEPSAVISPIRTVPIGLRTTSTQLTLTLVPDGVCHGGDGESTALRSRFAGEDICRRGSVVEEWTGEQASLAAVAGNGETGDQRSTGALGEAMGFLQRPQTYPSVSEGNTEPYNPERVAASDEVTLEQLGTAGTDYAASSVASTDPHNIHILPAMDYHPHGDPTATADECQQRRCHVSAKSHLANRATLKQRQSRLFQTVNHAQIIWNTDTKPNGILGGNINVRSILPKIDQIQNLLMESNLDFLCMSETWLNSSVPTDLINISGYTCYRKDRPKGRGGGVLIYIREKFKVLELELNVNLESLGLNVILSPNMKFTIVVLYNPRSHISTMN